jgi:hypothetical protein
VSSFPQPDDSRRCTGVSKKNGKRCGNWAIQGTDPGLCSAHSPDSANLILRDPHEAKRRSTERANQRKREAEERDELRRLGLKAMTTKRAENERERLLDQLFQHAFSPDSKVSMQALQVIFDRVLGRPTQSTLTINASADAQAVEGLREALQQIRPEERRLIARERLGLVAPKENDDDVAA